MKLLGRYIVWEYAKFFLSCLLSLIFIAIVFAAIPELEDLERDNGIKVFFDSILSGIPLLVEIITPISVLLATILTFLSLRRSSEILAMSAAGYSRGRMVLPIFLFGLLICFFIYINQSYLAPLWGADERTSVVKTKSSSSTWRFFNGKLFHFTGISFKTKEIESNTVFYFDSEHLINRIDNHHQLQLERNQWKGTQPSHRMSLRESSIMHNTQTFSANNEDQFPVIFKKELPFPKYASFSALIAELRLKRQGGVSFEGDLFALYQKIAALISIYIMMLLALPFSLYSHRESSIRVGIVTAVILGLTYFLIDQVFLSFNQSPSVSIEVSAFGANTLFLLLALYLIRLKQS